jgi:hypothetical protein
MVCALGGVALGCGYGYRTVVLGGRYSVASRPDPTYFCYDCHGYRFFDPYYDWCVYYGFRYRWLDHPRVIGLYRERYVRIKETHPDYGRFRYGGGYRMSRRYVDARDYESWRGAEGRGGHEFHRGPDGAREQGRAKRGEKRHGPREPQEPRDRHDRDPGSKEGQR